MSAENRLWSSSEDAEPDDDADGEIDARAAARGASVAKILARRGGVGEASQNPGHEPGLIGSFAVGRRPEQGTESSLADAPKERDSAPGAVSGAVVAEISREQTETAAPPLEAATEGLVPDNYQAEAVTVEQPDASLSAEAGPVAGDATSAEMPPVPEQAAPLTAEQALVAWTREHEQRLSEGQLYEGEAIWTRVPAQASPEARPAPQTVVTGETAAPAVVPTAAELHAQTGVSPYPASRVIRPAGSRTRPQPDHSLAARTPSMPPNFPPSAYNTTNVPNIPPNPNAGSGNNMNTPPPPPVGPPGGPPNTPPPFGMNPNNGGNWNPAQAWRQTAHNAAPALVGNALPVVPAQPAEAARGTGGALLGGILIGRYLFSGRRKLKREMRRGFQQRDRRIAHMEADQRFAQADQSNQQIRATHEQNRLNRELGSTRRRLGEVEQQHQELQMQHAGLAEQVQADQRKEKERREQAAKAEKGIKARAAEQVRGARARFERFRKSTEQPGRAAEAATEHPVAGQGNRFVRSEGEWLTNEVDAQGRLVSGAESALPRGRAYEQERAAERGLGGKSHAVGEMVLLAGGTAADRQTGGAASGDGSAQPYMPGAGPSGVTQSRIPGTSQSQSPHSGSVSPYDSVAGQKRAASPIWPYVLALAVIFICLVALLH